MKRSNIKLIFEDKKMLKFFSISLIYFLSKYSYWLKNCNFYSRKNNLYVYTHNYSYVDNCIKNNSKRYN